MVEFIPSQLTCQAVEQPRAHAEQGISGFLNHETGIPLAVFPPPANDPRRDFVGSPATRKDSKLMLLHFDRRAIPGSDLWNLCS